MPWQAFLRSASTDDKGAEVLVDFKRSEDGTAFVRTFLFPYGDPLTKASLKAKVLPVVDSLNNITAAVNAINTNAGADIATV